jgi:hypothetical protein
MRHATRLVLATLALLPTTACMPSSGTEPQGAGAKQPATVPATAEERQREIERRKALRGEQKLEPSQVAPAADSTLPVTGEVPEPMLASMRADLATRLGRPVDAARVMRAEQVIWPDGSLGCAQPGGIYTQATVVGYLVEFEFEGRNYRYHAALKGTPIYCDRPGPYVRSLGPDK